MGFVAEKEREEETRSPSITGSKASSLGDSDTWWWQKVKPFVNGELATVLAGIPIFLGDVATYKCLTKDGREYLTNAIKRLGLPLRVRGPEDFKITAANHGIHQEICCAALAGTVGAFISSPLYTTSARHDLWESLQYHIGANEGLSAFWDPGGLQKVAAYYAGMLPAYYQSYHYFKVSCGLDEDETRIRAGVVSAFFGTACYLPFHNVQLYMHAMRVNADGKFPFKSSLDCALKVLKA